MFDRFSTSAFAAHNFDDYFKYYIKKVPSRIKQNISKLLAYQTFNGLSVFIQALQAQLADTEQANAQRLIEVTSRHRQESELEVERLRTAQVQAERTLEARERAHRQRVKGLEEQVSF